MRLLITVLLAATSLGSHAQSACSSDGQVEPVALFERFISADCESCWSDAATPAPSAAGVAVLDWIVPGKAGDDAPLSAAATSDALTRLSALGRQPPTTTDVYVASVDAPPLPARLRVAHGLPFNDYLGTGISLTRVRKAKSHATPAPPLAFHLVLVEAVPANSDGTAVSRSIVRNVLQGTWNEGNLKARTKTGSAHWMETRSMRIPDGARAERLRLVGWVQDAEGVLVAAAQSVCR